MTNTNNRSVLRGTSLNPSSTFNEGNDPSFELSPQHFSELASELRIAEAQQQRRAVAAANFNPMSAAAAAAARNNGLTPPPSSFTATAAAPTNNTYPQPAPPQQQQGTDPGPDQAALHISRLYNHMLMQLPAAVQQRAQQHLIMRTANVSKSGVPVQQATMLVQQELLPLMQRAFMRLQQSGAIGNTATTTTNPATIGTNVGVQVQGANTNINNNTSTTHPLLGGAASTGAGASAGISAAGLATFAVGKAAAAPAIAATEAIIRQHQQKRAREMQSSDVVLIQKQQQTQQKQQTKQQHTKQQQQQQQRASTDAQFEFPNVQQQQQQQVDRQHAILQQHLKLKQLQAIQSLHMQAKQQQQQQQQQAVAGNGSRNGAAVNAAAFGNELNTSTAVQGAKYRSTSPSTHTGPAQGILNSMLSNSAMAVPPTAAAAPPLPALQHTAGPLTIPSNNTAIDVLPPINGTITITTTGYTHEHHHQQKKQRIDHATDTNNINNKNHSTVAVNNANNRNQLMNQWSELFEIPNNTIINHTSNNRIHIVTTTTNGGGNGGNGGGGGGGGSRPSSPYTHNSNGNGFTAPGAPPFTTTNGLYDTTLPMNTTTTTNGTFPGVVGMIDQSGMIPPKSEITIMVPSEEVPLLTPPIDYSQHHGLTNGLNNGPSNGPGNGNSGYVLDTYTAEALPTTTTNAITTTTITTGNPQIPNGFDTLYGSNDVGMVAFSRGKAASARMQAKEATQRYAWTAGMLNEIFSATPVDKTDLLKQEQKNAASAGLNGGAGYIIGSDFSGAPLPSPSPVEGTEGQKMLVAAAQRIHQGVVLNATEDCGGVDSVGGGGSNLKNFTFDQGQADQKIKYEEEDKISPKIDSAEQPLMPVSLTVTKLQLAVSSAADPDRAAAVPAAVGTERVQNHQGQISGLITEAELFDIESEPPLQLGNIVRSSNIQFLE